MLDGDMKIWIIIQVIYKTDIRKKKKSLLKYMQWIYNESFDIYSSFFFMSEIIMLNNNELTLNMLN